jgi:hypothetical protein|nr:DUF1993 domain-containing protein [Kofleriaceae bacterium]
MNHYSLTVPQLTKMLKNLDSWLTAAEKHAEAKKFDANTLLHARLAPDQFALVRQVQSCCDNAKFIAGRLTAKDMPSHPDTETTFEQLHARIATVCTYLGSFKQDDFNGAGERKITLPWWNGKSLTGDEYLIEFALPNFYFHVTTAYEILRHNGVDVGKQHFIGNLPLK